MAFNFLYITGNNAEVQVMYRFENEAAAFQWRDRVEAIKAQNRTDHGDLVAGRITQAGIRDRANTWLNVANGFVRQYGHELTPPDLKETINDAERFTGRIETNWNQ